jgi:hypothetical protein
MVKLSVYLADQTIAYMGNKSFVIGVDYGTEHPLLILTSPLWLVRTNLK